MATSGVWLWIKGAVLPAHERSDLIIVFLIAIVNVAVRSLIAYRSPKGTSGDLGWIFSAIDIVLIACAVNLTGRLASDLWLIYFFVVVTETLSVSVKAELTLDILVAAGYTFAIWPIVDGLTFATRLAFLFLTGAVARRLHSNAEYRRAQLSQLREELKVEQEKSRLAREIHDGVGREIVNAILGLEIAARTAERVSGEEAAPVIRENIGLLREAMDSTRQLIYETRPWTLDGDEGALSERIAQYARRFADRTRVAVDVGADSAVDGIAQSSAFAILRVIQESLNNAAKHARATSITIRAECVDNQVRLTVVDDGVGFDPAGVVGDGIGLKAMRERAEAMRGKIKIDSTPGRGTTIVLTVPLR